MLWKWAAMGHGLQGKACFRVAAETDNISMLACIFQKENTIAKIHFCNLYSQLNKNYFSEQYADV